MDIHLRRAEPGSRHLALNPGEDVIASRFSLAVDESKIVVEAELLDVAGLEQHDDRIGRSASDPAGRSFADIVEEDFHASTLSGPLLKWW